MKKSSIVILAVALVLIFIGVILGSSYNNLVELEETVTSKEADIDNQLQRRADLIPNLVNTVKGYTKHETEALELVTSARENLLKANGIAEKAEESEKLTNAINALMVIVENYPDLKADTQFTALQDELAGTENRIAIARKEYNDAVKNYNQKLKKIPTNMIASMFKFEEKKYFETKEENKEVPEVNFD